MYGTDAINLVFSAGHYHGYGGRAAPGVPEWFDQNLELIHCIGKMHLPLPQIGVLRSTRVTRLGLMYPWNWDVLARGTLQAVGRNFAYLEVPDILDGTIDQFPVVLDAGTVLMTDEDVEGIIEYVRRGGIFVAQHHTGRHSPDHGNAWPLARASGLNIRPKFITEENLHRWPLGKIQFTREQDLLPSLRGRQVEGSGVAIDWMGREHTGAIGITVADVGKDIDIHPVATWEDGSLAIVDVRIGRGRLIILGTVFYMRMRDIEGVWVNREDLNALVDEFLTALGVQRDSWTGSSEVWGELWQSKNGLFDLYPVARMAKSGDEVRSVNVALRKDTRPVWVAEMSALGRPRVNAQWENGRLTLPAMEYTLMQSRVFAAPRDDIERAALDWFKVQSRIWHALPQPKQLHPLLDIQKLEPIEPPADIIPLAEDWTLRIAGQPDRTVRLGAFATLGLPEDTVATFEKTVKIPAGWKGQRVDLIFDTEYWFWGILPYGRLLINGKPPAGLRQPIVGMPKPSFRVNVTDAAAIGTLRFALEIDGSKGDLRRQQRPHGVTGIFYLQATPSPVQTHPLTGWGVAETFGRLRPVETGERVKGLYLETRFTLPSTWPAERLFLESQDHIGFLVLNNHLIGTPSWMTRLDVSGMVYRDGRENVLRWVPGVPHHLVPHAYWRQPYDGIVPELNLVWIKSKI
jgi:hypothetical protein